MTITKARNSGLGVVAINAQPSCSRTASSICMTKCCWGFGNALTRSSCCCSFGAGPRLPAPRLAGLPIKFFDAHAQDVSQHEMRWRFHTTTPLLPCKRFIRGDFYMVQERFSRNLRGAIPARQGGSIVLFLLRWIDVSEACK